jgi:hypothetical protein
VGARRAAEAVDHARVVAVQLPRVLARRAEAEVEAPDGAVAVLREPDGRLVGRVLHQRVDGDVGAHLQLVQRLHFELHALLGRLRRVDGLEVPHPDDAVVAHCVDVAFGEQRECQKRGNKFESSNGDSRRDKVTCVTFRDTYDLGVLTKKSC